MTNSIDKAKLKNRLLESSVLWEDQADEYELHGCEALAESAMMVSCALNAILKSIDEGVYDLVEAKVDAQV